VPDVTINGMQAGGGRYANQTRTVDLIPDECPICHKKIVPEFLGQAFEFARSLEVFLRCTSLKCARAFIALYKGTPLSSGGVSYSYQRCVPSEPEAKVVSPAIAELSPTFVNIWKQAQTAEAQGLDEIAGPGYRKALEFLVKDYALSLVTDEADRQKIKTIPLQSVIQSYLPGAKLPVVSSRAAWLGNDETHYERRWIDRDLKDLKKLVEATEHFIAMERLVADIPLEMPDPKAAKTI
jgi:hypothetical protein